LPFLGAPDDVVYYRNNITVKYQWFNIRKYIFIFIFKDYSSLFFSIELVVSEYDRVIGLYSDDAEAFTVGGRNKQARIVCRGLYGQFCLVVVAISGPPVSSGFSNTV